MGYTEGHIVVVTSLFFMVSCAFLAKAEMKITVDKDNCGGRMNLDTIQTLHLNYYGAKLADGNFRQQDALCLFNITTSSDSEICIYNKGSPWDLACSESVKITIGEYLGVYIPSTYHCSDFEPLCTREKVVFLEYQYSRALHIMKKDIAVEFDIYIRKQTVTTSSTVLPSISSDSEENSGMAVGWIIAIAVGGTILLFCCCGCMYWICREDESEEESPNQNSSPVEVNSDGNAENMRMLQTPVIHLPPENRQHSASDPPDYYAVCPTGPTQQKTADTFNTLDPADEKVIPSAPPPPYPGI